MIGQKAPALLQRLRMGAHLAHPAQRSARQTEQVLTHRDVFLAGDKKVIFMQKIVNLVDSAG